MDLLDELPPISRDAVYEGLIKIKLVHARGFTVVLPDMLIVGSKWFQAQFFTAPLLSWISGGATCQFGFDLDEGTRLLVRFSSDRLVSHRPDGSSVYRCRVGGPKNLELQARGECMAAANGDILVWLYHHTEPTTVDAIRASGHFRGSEWNIQGTDRKLENVRYVYFTSVQQIRSDDDLQRIAMASKGVIPLRRTNAPNDIVWLKVYRASTPSRRASIRILVPADALASQHVYYHAPHGDVVHYEVPHAHIFRVGLLPGKVLPFMGDRVMPVAADLKQFDYVVLGDADTRIGLRAPYEEENTSAIFKIERMSTAGDLFTLWRRHANSDRFSGYAVDMTAFRPA